MSIVSSSYTIDNHSQVDGRTYVTETHTDSVGGVYKVEYLAEAGTNYATVMAARVAGIEQMLADAEAQQIVSG